MNKQTKIKLVHTVKQALSGRTKDNPANAKKISDHILLMNDIKINGSGIRDLINFIRSAGYITGICATHKGYYIAKSAEEIREYQGRLYQRLRQIQIVVEQLDRDAKAFEIEKKHI